MENKIDTFKTSVKSTAIDTSPCVRNCCLDSNDICLGCGRNLAEILEWSSASSLRRQEIIALAHLRGIERSNYTP